jgi:hypothetical protein
MDAVCEGKGKSRRRRRAMLIMEGPMVIMVVMGWMMNEGGGMAIKVSRTVSAMMRVFQRVVARAWAVEGVARTLMTGS